MIKQITCIGQIMKVARATDISTLIRFKKCYIYWALQVDDNFEKLELVYI